MLAISSTHNSQSFPHKSTGKAVEIFHFRQLLCARQKSLVFGEAGKKPKVHKIELRAFFFCCFFHGFNFFHINCSHVDTLTYLRHINTSEANGATNKRRKNYDFREFLFSFSTFSFDLHGSLDIS